MSRWTELWAEVGRAGAEKKQVCIEPSELARLLSSVEAFEDALTFYAVLENYQRTGFLTSGPTAGCRIDEDMGQTARTALSKARSER